MSFPTLSGPDDHVRLRGGSAQAQTVGINASSAGANVVVPAVPSAVGTPARIIRVLAYLIVAANAVSVTWESSGGTILGGPMAFAANGGAAPPYNPLGWFDTKPGEDLVLFLGGAVQVGGHVTYLVVQ